MPDTIAAVATPAGRGGIGIVRISGPLTPGIARAVLGELPAPRRATYGRFVDAEGDTVDTGLSLYFPAPGSYTGEDVLELHGHGGPVVLDMLLECVLRQGARHARPGEFTERAFLNDKLDLAQAEAVADLIDGQTRAAVRGAQRSLEGDFSRAVHALAELLAELRTWTEAAIDFPEEEIDFLSTDAFAERLATALERFGEVRRAAERGVLLLEGVNVAIVGAPNVGKSTLFNLLAGRDAAIVTEIPGTTRDTVREHVHVDGLPMHIADTAGLRETDDPVEREGIRRTRRAIVEADVVIYMVEHDPKPEEIEELLGEIDRAALLVVRNKIDLSGDRATSERQSWGALVRMSALTGAGLEHLRSSLELLVGYQEPEEGSFIARRRHLEALARGHEALCAAEAALRLRKAGELAAEDLRRSLEALGEITGEYTTEDLLGRIFSSFCIGK